jgi:hypothetical protein
MNNNMYDAFRTDPALEKGGVKIDYGQFRVTIARAGGSNKRYSKVMEARTKPYRRAIQTETMDLELAAKIFKRIYAETIVIDWEVKNEDGEWVKGIMDPDTGDILPVTVDNVEKVLISLNEIFIDLKEQAEKFVLFKKHIQEEEAKN